MNSRSHWLSLFSAAMHLVIGLTDLLRIGPRFLPPSWVVIYSFLPGAEWLWPGLFVLTGVIAAIGGRRTDALRLGFRLSSFIFLVWGLVGLYSWSNGSGGNIPGSAANVFLSGCAWVLGYYVSVGKRSDTVNAQVVQLAEKLDVPADIGEGDE